MSKLKELFGPSGEYWIKNFSCLDSNRNSIIYTKADAKYFCLTGALLNLRLDTNKFILIQNYIKKKIGNQQYVSIAYWNDLPETKWEDVEELIKELNL